MSSETPATHGVDLLQQAVRETIALHERALTNSAPVMDAAGLIVTTLKAGGKHVSLTPPAAGPIQVIVGLRDPSSAEATNACATGGGTFHATKKGVLKFP